MSIQIIRDLRTRFGSARDQRQRPTCLAFAASDGHASRREPWNALSCEYAFFHAVRRCNGNPHAGVDIASMLSAVEVDGQPAETHWPYLSSLPADLALWHPPADVGELLCAKTRHLTGGIARIRESLDAEQPILIGMTVSDAFYMPRKGVVAAIAESVDPTRRHAVLAVGYGLNGTEAFVLIRNSWGSLWGTDGYAWLSESYLSPRIVELASIERAS
jgi:hypothetical protein